MEEQTNPVLELPYSYNVNITNENDWIEEDDDSSSYSNYDENEIYEVEIHPEELDELMQELKEIKGLSTGKLLTIRNELILISEKIFHYLKGYSRKLGMAYLHHYYKIRYDIFRL